MFEVGSKLKERGWFLQIQPGSSDMGMPTSLHLNSSPVHDQVAGDFIKSLKEITDELNGRSPRSIGDIMKDVGATDLSIDASRLTEVLISEDSPLKGNPNLLYELIRHLPSDVVEQAFLEMVNNDFTAATED